MKRRQFIQTSALASLGPFFPRFLKPFDGNPLAGEKILVVVQLSGGNDGLNTLVPFRNDVYYKSRPTLGIQAKTVLRLDDNQGFNPALPEMRELFQQGKMTVVHGVGYPNPARSHFRAMDIWHSASGAESTLNTGWLGRYLDTSCTGCERDAHALYLDVQPILALRGEKRNGFSAGEIHKLNEIARNTSFQKMVRARHSQDHEALGMMYQTLASAVSTAGYLTEAAGKVKSRNVYPQGYLAQQLKRTAELIAGGCYAKVYYLHQTGYDTHTNQLAGQNTLLAQLSQSIGAFVKDMNAFGRMDDILIMVFSEFGRRVLENGSGTDHGTANQVYFIGNNLPKPGFWNQPASLTQLDPVGDLIHTVDFRQVYSTVLEKWLNTPASKVLQGDFKPLNLL